jgi:hypothetical protein
VRLGVAIVAWLAACGSDGASTDATPPADARFFADAAIVPCSEEDACPSDGRRPICDLERGRCVECRADADCEGAGSHGPVCDALAGACTCAVDDDCEGRATGPVCHEGARACGCRFDDECTLDDRTCELDPYLGADVRSCRPGDDR